MTFNISNESSIAYQQSIIFIGVYNVQGDYKATDSIILNKIEKGGGTIPYYFNENRWKPDLAKIRALPYFMIKLSNGREEFFKTYRNNNPKLAVKLPDLAIFEGDYGFLNVDIENDFIFATVIKKY